MYVAVNNLNLVGTEVHTPRSHIPPQCPTLASSPRSWASDSS